MQCTEYAPEKIKPGKKYWMQRKLDGICCIVLSDNTYQTRQGKIWRPEILPAIPKNTTGYPVIGELHIPNRTVSSVVHTVGVNRTVPHKDKDSVKFSVYDVANTDDPHWISRLWLARNSNFIGIPPYQIGESVMEGSPPLTIDSYYEQVIKSGGEGLVIREDFCPYVPGTNSPHQMKRKPVHTIDATIIGFERGLGKFRNTLGALIVRLDSGAQFSVAGMNNVTRDEFWFFQKQSLGQVVTVAYDSLSEDGIPLKPRVKIVRDYE